jgi:predicted ribosome quality control (RQC) complex YloA/Tae2 family protein
MHAASLELLIAELAPKVAGARVVDARLDGSTGALVLTLSGREPRALTVSAEPPGVMFLAPAPGDARKPPASRSAGERGRDGALERELRGATVEELRMGPHPSAAEILFSRSDDVGRTTRRTLAIELGRRPGLAMSETVEQSPRPRTVETPAGPPTVHWRRDPEGRLHARLSAGAPTAPCDGSREFATFNDAAAHLYNEFARPIGLERRRHRLAKQVKAELDRKLRAIEKVEAEIADSARAPEYRRQGQVLLTRKDEVRRGDTTARLLDYDGTTVIEVGINPALTPAQNAEALFRRAKRAGRRTTKAPARLAQLRPEAAKAKALLNEIGRADELELAALESRLSPTPGAAPARKADAERARFRTYTVTGGWQVLVGKSNRDNDVLTHKVARPEDLWFHARQAAGSHVILKKAGTGREPEQAAILEAAAIAAHHSKAGKSRRVAVCYTEAKHVRKPRGGAPGLAIVAREKVVMVEPKLPEG